MDKDMEGKGKCMKMFADSGMCPEEHCMMNEKTGHCYMKHGMDKKMPCSDVCETYKENCLGEGKAEKMKMVQCMIDESGAMSECGSCLQNAMDKMRDGGDKDKNKVMVNMTMRAYERMSDCNKQREERMLEEETMQMA